METSNYIFNLLSQSTGEIVAGVIVALLPLLFILPYALVAIYMELKVSAFMQDKLGPMRTGPWGMLQPVAEIVKLLQKEDITPYAADKALYNIAPYLIFIGAYTAFAVIPFSSYFVPAGINIGLFFVLAVSSFAVLGLFVGGWASNNKYSLMGAMRSVAQIISYEIPAAMAILGVAAMANSLDMNTIIQHQQGGFWNWFVFGGPGGVAKLWVLPFTLAMFIIYLIATLAETNRTPFDIPEGESEIVAGYHTEYGGMKFAIFFLAEYANMFVVSALITIIFCGGWSSPFGDFLNSPIWQAAWFILKAMGFVFLQIWLRWTLPRLRVDQLMFLCWKVMLPITFVCFFAMALCRMLN
jgi:NADH-quinone oxidoreductase subunit H